MYMETRLSERLLFVGGQGSTQAERATRPRAMRKSGMSQVVYSPRRRVREGLALFPVIFGLAVTLMVAAGTTQLGYRVVRGALSDTKPLRLSIWESAKRELSAAPEEKTCEEPYGGLPCSTSLTGSIFLMVAYGFILLIAARMISDGSEMLLEVLNPGLIGGLLLPTLGALPDTLLIAVSGLGGSQEEAKKQVLVGVGVLAGSTIMILTLLWGGSLILGRCDLEGEPPVAKDGKLTKVWSLTETGVTCDKQTSWGAYVMMASVIPYIVVQIPIINGHNDSEGKTASLIGAIVAGVSLLLVFAYQVFIPNLQNKKMAEARLQFIRTHALMNLSRLSEDKSWGGLLKEDGVTPNEEPMRLLFAEFDKDNSGGLSKAELKALIVGIGLEHEKHVPSQDEVEAWLKEFDADSDETLTLPEFQEGLAKWMSKVRKDRKEKHLMNWKSLAIQRNVEEAVNLDAYAEEEGGDPEAPLVPSRDAPRTDSSRVWDAHASRAKGLLEILEKEVEEEVEEEEEEKEEHEVKTTGQIYREALFWIVAGVGLVAVFADPMVDSVSSFSEHSGIPSFFVAFIVTPLASNASEVVSSLIFAMKKKKRTLSLTFSQVYGAITMNNTMCMMVFLLVVYARGLLWEFSAEVTVILLVTFLVGLLGATRTTFPLWTAFPAIALYPLSIAFVAVLDYVVGWK